mgnify:CR=1 FL=1
MTAPHPRVFIAASRSALARGQTALACRRHSNLTATIAAFGTAKARKPHLGSRFDVGPFRGDFACRRCTGTERSA